METLNLPAGELRTLRGKAGACLLVKAGKLHVYPPTTRYDGLTFAWRTTCVPKKPSASQQPTGSTAMR